MLILAGGFCPSSRRCQPATAVHCNISSTLWNLILYDYQRNQLQNGRQGIKGRFSDRNKEVTRFVIWTI